MFYLAVGTIFRNENSWLDEWIRYHHAIGVERFYLYCDEMDSRVSDRILRPYIEKNLVELVHVRNMIQLEQDANIWRHRDVVCDVIRKTRGRTRWLALIDLDEFILPRPCNDLRELLERYELESALAINWNMFGTNGYVKRPPTQINHLLHRAEDSFSSHQFVKSIVCPENVLIEKIDNVHLFPMRNGQTVDERGLPVWNMRHTISTEIVRINHYAIRSWQDIWEVKAIRARSAGTCQIDEQYFTLFDRNEVFDDEISKRFGAVLETP